MIRLREEGAIVDVAGEVKHKIYQGKFGLKVESNLSFDEVEIQTYDGILIPGGWAPDYLRRLPKVLSFVQYI